VGSMDAGFYRNGLWARGLVEISDDSAVLEDGNFWSLLITYEGERIFARFSDVQNNQAESFLSYARQHKWLAPLGEWKSSLSKSGYLNGVHLVRQEIGKGEVYQINLCRILSIESQNKNLLALLPRLVVENPAPFLTSLELPNISIASASPELLLRRDGKVITSSPIKGTAKTKDGFLEKDRAENVMIVDLVRHDFGSVCAVGSVTTPRLLSIEEHPGLVHLVSDVQGELRRDTSWDEILSALLPAGSISGAPKTSARELIKRLEPVARGPYCGAIGWVWGDRAEIAVGIRTFWREPKDKLLKFGTGAGITWGSEPELEWAETELKAVRLLSIIGQRD
jgi:para-aminobenzoate synthetase component 1